MPRQDLIKLRRGTALEWSTVNPTLEVGEYGYETDTKRSKIGDGVQSWNDLGYILAGNSGIDNIVAGTPNVSISDGATTTEKVISVTQTTAGLLSNVYFTADEITTTEGTFYKTLINDKGLTPQPIPTNTITLDDNETGAFPVQFLGDPSPINNPVVEGVYAAFPVLEVNSNQANQRIMIEAYVCDTDGVPLNGGGQVGFLGVETVLIADSGVIDIQQGNPTSINCQGFVDFTQNPNTITEVLVGQRFRYVVIAEKVGTGGNVVDFTLLSGSDYNSYYQIPTISITTGFDPNAIHKDVPNEFDLITEVTEPNNDSFVLIEDELGAKKKVKVGNLGGGVGDNLGDHTATQDLQMSSFEIVDVDRVNGIDIREGTAAETIAVGRGVMGTDGLIHVTAIGGSSMKTATGNYSTAVGSFSLENNTGRDITGFGKSAGRNNDGDYNTLLGNYAGRDIIGDDNVGVGNTSLSNNVADKVVAIGRNVGKENTGDNMVAVGFESLTYNTKENNTAVGFRSGYRPQLDTANAKILIDPVNHIDPSDNINIPNHGFGNTGDIVGLLYNFVGTKINPLQDNTIYAFVIVDSDHINPTTNISAGGTGTHTFTPFLQYENITLLGANTFATKDNQVVLGDENIEEIYTDGSYKGNAFIKDGGTNDEVLLADGSTTSISGISQSKLVENLNVSGSYDIDYSFDSWNLVVTGATSFTESNLPLSGTNTKVITLYVQGEFPLTFPAGWSTNIIGEYDGSVRNQIVVEFIKTGDYAVEINQPD